MKNEENSQYTLPRKAISETDFDYEEITRSEVQSPADSSDELDQKMGPTIQLKDSFGSCAENESLSKARVLNETPESSDQQAAEEDFFVQGLYDVFETMKSFTITAKDKAEQARQNLVESQAYNKLSETAAVVSASILESASHPVKYGANILNMWDRTSSENQIQLSAMSTETRATEDQQKQHVSQKEDSDGYWVSQIRPD